MAKQLFRVTETMAVIRRTYIEAETAENAVFGTNYKYDWIHETANKQLSAVVVDRANPKVLEEAIQTKALTEPTSEAPEVPGVLDSPKPEEELPF